MLTTGDSIAIAAVCATVIAAILKLIPSRNSKGNNPGDDNAAKVAQDLKEHKKTVVYTNTCEAIHKGVDDKLDMINDGIGELRKIILGRK